MTILNPAKRDRDILKCFIDIDGKLVTKPDIIMEACLK